MLLVELVQQGALQLEAGHGVVARLQLALDGVLQAGEVGHAEGLGELVVQRRLDRGADLLHLDLELGLLALQAIHPVLLGEGHLQGDGGVGLGALQLFLEAGDELARAQHDLGVGGRAAFEFLAVDAADEIGHHHVAVLGLHGLAGAGLVGPVLRAEFGQSLVHLRVGRLIDGALQLELLDVDRLELRDQLDLQLIDEISLAREHLVDVGFQLQVRLARRAQLVFFQRLLGALRQGLLDHLVHQGAAVDAADMRRRHLARAEPLEVETRRDLCDLGLEPLGQVGRRRPDLIDAV